VLFRDLIAGKCVIQLRIQTIIFVEGLIKFFRTPFSAASDIWALGVTLHQLILGFTAFHSPSPYLTFLKIQKPLLHVMIVILKAYLVKSDTSISIFVSKKFYVIETRNDLETLCSQK
jgi:serine/threonine protein kinase